MGVMAAIVVQDQATTAGIASLPTPIDEPDASFFVYEPFIHELQVQSQVGVQFPSGTLTRFDSKAMRKVGLNEDIALIAETSTVDGAIITVRGRMLVKLH